MLSFGDFLLETSKNIGGMVARSLSTVAVPIPGAGLILSPVTSRVGEFAGSFFPDTRKIPSVMRDSIRIYSSAGHKNTSFIPQKQIEARKDYMEKAKKLGYNTTGQTIAAIDPTLVSIVPNNIIKK